MEAVKRKVKITHEKFCGVFTKRTFTTRDKLLRSIYIIEDVDGNYRVEEHPSILGYLVLSMVLVVIFIPMFLYEGVVGLLNLKDDIISLIKRRPLRVDELKHNIHSTCKILEIIGWW